MTLSRENSENSVSNWNWTGAHTRQRFQLLTLSLILFCLAKYDVESIANLVITFSDANKPGFGVTYGFFLIFYIYTFIGFWLLSDVEAIEKREQEAIILNSISQFDGKSSIYFKDLLRNISQLNQFPDLSEKMLSTTDSVAKTKTMGVRELQKHLSSMKKILQVKDELDPMLSKLQEIIQEHTTGRMEQDESKVSLGDSKQRLGQQISKLRRVFDSKSFENEIYIDMQKYLTKNAGLELDLEKYMVDFKSDLGELRDISKSFQADIVSLTNEFQELISQSAPELNVLVRNAQKNHRSSIMLRRWGKWVPMFVSATLVSLSLYFFYEKICGI